MENEVLRTAKKYKLIDEGDIIIVGLSGGADSVSLLVSLNNLKDKLGIKKLIGVHINHCLRDTADRDEEFSKKICEKLGIEFYSAKLDVKEISKNLKVCEEEAGRIARYSFFNEIREKTGADKIATAHNKNDQTETFIMRMLRGGGSEALSSIKPLREDGVIRPLINTDKNKIIEYLNNISQDYMTDETNLKTDYFRNKIRLELIPYLKENFGLNENVISGITDSLRQDAVYIKGEAEKYLRTVEYENNRVIFDRRSLKNLPEALMTKIIILAVKKISGENIQRENIENIRKIINSDKTGLKADISGIVEAANEYDKFIIKKKVIINKYSYNIKPGRNYIKEGGFTVILSEELSKTKDTVNIPEFSTLTVRTREDGDRMYVEKTGHKKIKDILIDKKIPREERDKIPLICKDGEIIALYGLYKRKFNDCKYGLRIEWEAEKNV